MDPRLKYASYLYSKKLSEYAAYTIDIKTPVGVFRQRANKREDVTVVDEGEGNFRIYMTYRPLMQFITTIPRSIKSKRDLYIRVTIKDDVTIAIQEIKFLNYLMYSLYILLLIAASILSFDEEPFITLIFIPLIPLPFLFHKISHKRFKTLLIDFLNDAAEQ
jgi:hypothetical protein